MKILVINDHLRNERKDCDRVGGKRKRKARKEKKKKKNDHLRKTKQNERMGWGGG